ncbi:MAG TPA: Mur ligase family protein [Roseiarcus sp.]|nr:Mur ligase family protein [Roseiarcus sp.]
MSSKGGDRKLTQTMARLDALTDWERRLRGRMRVSLAPMQDLAQRLGEPQNAFRAIHVAGTKGKGSVSALIEAGLVHAGLKAGRYGSPHVERVTERVSIGGRDVSDATLAQALDLALDAYEDARRAKTAAAEATWFDLMTAAAFAIFRDAGVQWAVVEVGLGGRLDSTNVVDGEIAVVTNIGLEHTEILGSTRAAIAGEKIGILKPGAVLVTSLAADDEAGRVLDARAGELLSSVIRVKISPDATIEETNVALAGVVLDELGRRKTVRDASCRLLGAHLLDTRTRAAARLVGRMERIDANGAPVVFDGAHVPFNLAAVLRDLAREPDLAGPCVAVVALAADKDAAGFLTELRKRASAAVFTELPSATRRRSPDDLRDIAAGVGLASEVKADPKAALKRGLRLAREANAWLLVTGSLYLVGALRGEVASRAR